MEWNTTGGILIEPAACNGAMNNLKLGDRSPIPGDVTTNKHKIYPNSQTVNEIKRYSRRYERGIITYHCYSSDLNVERLDKTQLKPVTELRWEG